MRRGTWSSLVLGLTAGGIAWGITSGSADFPSFIPNQARLDQLTGWILGSTVGFMVLWGRGRRVRIGSLGEGLLGGALGGFAVLLVVTTFGALGTSATPLGFVVMRAMTWSAGAALTCTLLVLSMQKRALSVVLESAGYGMLGGFLAGLVLALPGPPDLWQAIGFLLFGGAVGLGTVGPVLRGAAAVADQIPRRRQVPGIASLREVALYEGGSILLGEATLACHDGRVALYPPRSGAVLNGRVVVAPCYLDRGGVLLVVDQRFRLELAVNR